MQLEEDFSELRLRCLERHYRSAQIALAQARTLYASLEETPAATDLQRHQAQLRVQWATCRMLQAIAQLERRGWNSRVRP